MGWISPSFFLTGDVGPGGARSQPPGATWQEPRRQPGGGRALKSVGERNTHGGVGAGTSGNPPARGAVGVARLAVSVAIWRRGLSPAGKLLTVRWASGERLRRSQLACAHAVLLAGHDLDIIYYIALRHHGISFPWSRSRRLELRLPSWNLESWPF
jgi:hypothetical protein